MSQTHPTDSPSEHRLQGISIYRRRCRHNLQNLDSRTAQFMKGTVMRSCCAHARHIAACGLLAAVCCLPPLPLAAAEPPVPVLVVPAPHLDAGTGETDSAGRGTAPYGADHDIRSRRAIRPGRPLPFRGRPPRPPCLSRVHRAFSRASPGGTRLSAPAGQPSASRPRPGRRSAISPTTTSCSSCPS